ncbi:MAG: YncE family protein [Calditrichaeota bacterium]|nr:MAG: YncE family protein [Calditrichota bacterium]
MRTFFTFLGVILLATFLACNSDKGTTQPPPEIDYSTIPTDQISYAQHVQVILNEYAGKLQSAGLYPPGLQMDSWENLMKGWEHGEVVIPFDADNSLLIELSTKANLTDQLRNDKLDLLIRWINAGCKNDAGEVPFADSPERLYVCSQGEAIVDIIDVANLVVMRTVDLTQFGFPRSAKPHHIEFTPDHNFWFVSCIDPEVDRVLKFDVATNQLQGEATTNIPALLAHHPTEDILYVSRFMINNTSDHFIHVLNSATMQPFDNGNNGDINLPPNMKVPHAMAIDGMGNYAYTASLTEDVVLVIDHQTKEFVDFIDLGMDRTPLQIAISPDNTRAYVSCIGTGEIVVIDISDPNNRHIVGAVQVGGQPWHGTFLPDGSKFYVGNLANNTFSVINTADLSVQTYGAGDGSDGLAQPHGIAASSDGRYVFISGRNTGGDYVPTFDLGDNAGIGTVVVINTADNSIVKVIEIENFGSGMRLWTAP